MNELALPALKQITVAPEMNGAWEEDEITGTFSSGAEPPLGNQYLPVYYIPTILLLFIFLKASVDPKVHNYRKHKGNK